MEIDARSLRPERRAAPGSARRSVQSSSTCERCGSRTDMRQSQSHDGRCPRTRQENSPRPIRCRGPMASCRPRSSQCRVRRRCRSPPVRWSSTRPPACDRRERANSPRNESSRSSADDRGRWARCRGACESGWPRHRLQSASDCSLRAPRRLRDRESSTSRPRYPAPHAPTHARTRCQRSRSLEDGREVSVRDGVVRGSVAA